MIEVQKVILNVLFQMINNPMQFMIPTVMLTKVCETLQGQHWIFFKSQCVIYVVSGCKKFNFEEDYFKLNQQKFLTLAQY